MSQIAEILEMKILGFSHEHIARHLGLGKEQVNEIVLKNTRPLKKKKEHAKQPSVVRVKTRDRKAERISTAPAILPKQTELLKIPEVKPGVYLLSAEDLLAFFSRFKEPPAALPDPYQDYVQKEDFQKQYGISDTTLLRHQKDGLLNVYRLGNKQYLKKSQVTEALEKGRI